MLSDLTYRQRFCLQGAKTEKIADFFLKPFLCNNFWLKPCTNFLLPESCSSRQDTSNELSLYLEMSCWKLWPQVKVMTWPEKVMLHISRSASSAWTHLWCFHRSSWSLSKGIPEKNLLVAFHDLKWPWWHDEGSSVAIFRLSGHVYL